MTLDFESSWGSDRIARAAAARARRAAVEVDQAERRPHLVFEVAGLPFALPLADVEKIVAAGDTLPVPGAPATLRSVLSLPGTLVAVLDLAVLFELTSAVRPAQGHLLVAGTETSKLEPPAGKLTAGLLVDRVRLVLDLAPSEIVAPPRTAGLFAAQWIAGLARTAGGYVPILDLGALLGAAAVRAAVAAAGSALGTRKLESEGAGPTAAPIAGSATPRRGRKRVGPRTPTRNPR